MLSRRLRTRSWRTRSAARWPTGCARARSLTSPPAGPSRWSARPTARAPRRPCWRAATQTMGADRLQRHRCEHGGGHRGRAGRRPSTPPSRCWRPTRPTSVSSTRATRPRVIVLMNLSRDFLERGVRAKKLADALAADDRRDRLAVHDRGECRRPSGRLVRPTSRRASFGWPVTTPSSATGCSAGTAWSPSTGPTARLALPRAVASSGRRRRGAPQSIRTRGADGLVPAAFGAAGHAAGVNALFAVAAAVAAGRGTGQVAAQRIAEVENVDGRYAPHRFRRAHRPGAPGEEPGQLDRVHRHGTTSLPTVTPRPSCWRWPAGVAAADRTPRCCGTRRSSSWSARTSPPPGAAVTSWRSGWSLPVSRSTALATTWLPPFGAQPPGSVELIANWPAFNAVLDRIGRGA